jgi:hypothetical protein
VAKSSQTPKFFSAFKTEHRTAAGNGSPAKALPEAPKGLGFKDGSTFSAQAKPAKMSVLMPQKTASSLPAGGTGFSNKTTGVPWLDAGLQPPKNTPVTLAPSTPVPGAPVTPPWLNVGLQPPSNTPVTPKPSTPVPSAPVTPPWLNVGLPPPNTTPVTPKPSTGVTWVDDALKPPNTTPVTPKPSTGVTWVDDALKPPSTPAPVGSLKDVLNGSVKLKPGDSGPAVTELQKLIGAPQTGVFDAATSQKVAELKGRYQLGGDPTLVGKTTLEVFQQKLAPSNPPQTSRPVPQSPGAVAGNFSVDTQNPTLLKLATGRLTGQGDFTCVASTLINMERLGVPQPLGTGDDVGNNPRGGMVQLVRDFGWRSLPLPGSKVETINSPAYGTIQASVIPAAEYEKLARAGQIPSGAVVFQTRHGSWNDNSDRSRGFDMGIVRNGGRETFNFEPTGPLVYGAETRSVVILVPGNALKQQ